MLNRRDVYTDADYFYAVIAETGRFDMTDRTGRHDREINFDGAQTAPRDESGARDLAFTDPDGFKVPIATWIQAR